MALVGCRECGKEVSSSAKRCPKCGIKNPAPGTWLGLLGISCLILVPFVGMIIYLHTKYGS